MGEADRGRVGNIPGGIQTGWMLCDQDGDGFIRAASPSLLRFYLFRHGRQGERCRFATTNEFLGKHLKNRYSGVFRNERAKQPDKGLSRKKNSQTRISGSIGTGTRWFNSAVQTVQGLLCER